MHGKYHIKAVDSDGAIVVEYYGETHPLKDGTLVMPDGSLRTVYWVRHVLKTDRNGSQVYTSLDYVQLVVSTPEQEQWGTNA